MILGVIESSKKASMERSVDYFIEAVELKNIELMATGEALENGIYTKDTLGTIDIKGIYPSNLCLQIKEGSVLQGEFEFDGQVLSYQNGTITRVNHSVTCPYPMKGMLVGFHVNQSPESDTITDYTGKGLVHLKNITKADFQNGILTLNGIDQGIVFPFENYDFKTELTIITRIRFDQNSNVDQAFFGNWEYAGFGLLLQKEGLIEGQVNMGGSYQGITSPNPLPFDIWSTIALVYDGENLKLWIDGNLVASKSVSGTIKPSIEPIVLGYNPENPNQVYLPAHVSVKNAFVYTRGLTDDEIKAHYQLDLAKTP